MQRKKGAAVNGMKITVGILIVLTLAFWLAMFKGGGVGYG